MNTIYKYPLLPASENVVDMPLGARVLCVQMQRDYPCLWALVNEDQRITQKRRFYIFGTGHGVSDAASTYIGTVQMLGGSIVWHVFEGAS